MGGIVAIIGRPNVGKSTFFNRLIKKREAIVDAISGVTRDRHYGKSDWNGIDFTLIDTGGYLENSDDVFQKEIDKQVNLAIEEADAIFFMVDLVDGITGMDETIAKLLRRSQKPIFLTANKGEQLKRVGTFARMDLQTFFGKKVHLELFVKVEKNWRSNPKQLKRFGYQQ